MQLWEGLASVPGTVCQCPSFHHDSPLGKVLPGPQTDRLSRVAEQPGRFSAGRPQGPAAHGQAASHPHAELGVRVHALGEPS